MKLCLQVLVINPKQFWRTFPLNFIVLNKTLVFYINIKVFSQAQEIFYKKANTILLSFDLNLFVIPINVKHFLQC